MGSSFFVCAILTSSAVSQTLRQHCDDHEGPLTAASIIENTHHQHSGYNGERAFSSMRATCARDRSTSDNKLCVFKRWIRRIDVKEMAFDLKRAFEYECWPLIIHVMLIV